jgi:hypothetical protein
MPDPYSQVNLVELEDAAPQDGFADRWQARVARTALGVVHVPRLVGRVPNTEGSPR